jgi:hypothetical protein
VTAAHQFPFPELYSEQAAKKPIWAACVCRAAVEELLSWQPEGIILSHGRCFESDGSAILRRLFGWVL